MSKCFNRQSSEMLFAYEIGVLDSDRERQFEEHLLECNDCWMELDRFANAAEHLRYSSQIRYLLQENPTKQKSRTPN